MPPAWAASSASAISIPRERMASNSMARLPIRCLSVEPSSQVEETIRSGHDPYQGIAVLFLQQSPKGAGVWPTISLDAIACAVWLRFQQARYPAKDKELGSGTVVAVPL